MKIYVDEVHRIRRNDYSNTITIVGSIVNEDDNTLILESITITLPVVRAGRLLKVRPGNTIDLSAPL